MPATRDQWVLLRGGWGCDTDIDTPVATPAASSSAAACSASCDGVALEMTPPGHSPGFWMQSDEDSGIGSAEAAPGSGLVVACGKVATNAPHQIRVEFS
jgi:hypothetical protein